MIRTSKAPKAQLAMVGRVPALPSSMQDAQGDSSTGIYIILLTSTAPVQWRSPAMECLMVHRQL